MFSEIVYGHIAGFGITAGAHRLWAHKSYRAKLPLRILLAYMYCMAGMVRYSVCRSRIIIRSVTTALKLVIN